MPVPDEPELRWLNDYHYTDFSAIEADITAMEQFATGLKGNVQQNYDTHALVVEDLMMTPVKPQQPEFEELFSFLQKHNEAQNISTKNVHNFSVGTTQAADAAHKISKEYRNSDAFSHARVSDVDAAFTAASTEHSLATSSDKEVTD
jgi:hypothetical protein